MAVAAALLLALPSGCSVPEAPVPGPAAVPSAPARGASAPTAPGSPVAATTAAASPAPGPVRRVAPLRLTSVANFRDVAGAGLELSGGGEMATGVVYRSALLHGASRSDLARLRAAGVTLVIDLRTDGEASRRPDPDVRGLDVRSVNLLATREQPGQVGKGAPGARAHMRELNASFVTDPRRRARVAEVLRLVASADGGVLVHCTAGKDRTGWISAVLQLVAGADREQVVAEYLRSNTLRADEIAANFRSTLASRGRLAAEAKRARDTVSESYLGAGLAVMERRYGGLDGYLSDGLGLTAGTIAELRARLTA